MSADTQESVAWPEAMNIYIAVSYRYGKLNGERNLFDVGMNLDRIVAAARSLYHCRGGKYAVAVYCFEGEYSADEREYAFEPQGIAAYMPSAMGESVPWWDHSKDADEELGSAVRDVVDSGMVGVPVYPTELPRDERSADNPRKVFVPIWLRQLVEATLAEKAAWSEFESERDKDDFGVPSIDPGPDEDDDADGDDEAGGDDRAPVVTSLSEYASRRPHDDD